MEDDLLPPVDDFWAKTLEIIEKEKKFAPNVIIVEDAEDKPKRLEVAIKSLKKEKDLKQEIKLQKVEDEVMQMEENSEKQKKE